MPTNDEQEVLTQEENLTLATRNLDIAALQQIYADDILMTSVLGDTCGKSTVIDEAKRGAAQRAGAVADPKHIEASYDKEDLKIVLLSDAAVTSYRFVVRMKGPGIDVHRRYRTTNVWAKRHESWQVVAAHTAFVLDPKQVASLEKEGASSAGTS
jgi:ketosteroid isomerase-like protein